MEFGIFSNGFRPHTTAAATYEEDLREIILADELGFRDAWISEHHGEPVYIDKVDTLSMPELLMCKAAALTKRIRFGAAIKVIHLQHPVDVAIQLATSDHVIGNNRFMFGFGSGFPSPQFSVQRGLTFDDRHSRMLESLELILKCWSAEAPFDFEGKHWRGKGIVATPRPLATPHHMPIAVATEHDSILEMAAQRGYTLLSAFLEPARTVRKKGEKYARAALAAGHTAPLKKISAARMIYVTDSEKQGIEELRAAVTFELGFQMKRGFVQLLKGLYGLPFPNDTVTFDELIASGLYIIGDPDSVARRLRDFYVESGGFGTLLMVTGKAWATSEKRARSMRLFMEQVAPQLRDLEPGAVAAKAA